jgi:hypothetical protein
MAATSTSSRRRQVLVFVLDRVSGSFWPSKSVPSRKATPGEQTSPTQPFPTLPPPRAAVVHRA